MALVFYPTKCQIPVLRSRRFHFLEAVQVCTFDKHAGHEVLLQSESSPPIPRRIGRKEVRMTFLSVAHLHAYQHDLGLKPASWQIYRAVWYPGCHCPHSLHFTSSNSSACPLSSSHTWFLLVFQESDTPFYLSSFDDLFPHHKILFPIISQLPFPEPHLKVTMHNYSLHYYICNQYFSLFY
jgi:hypothetical protein